MENKEKVFRVGPIRPPSEANSLLLQVTAGCTWNKCKFCQLYKNSPFRSFSVDSIKEDIDTMAYYAEIAKKYVKKGFAFRNYSEFHECKTMTHNELNCFYMIFNWLDHGGENVFLQDGNSLALKPERVEEVLLYLKKAFPQIKRVTTYARAETLSKITLEQYKALKAAGLNQIHSGYETGSDEVLTLINKGVTAEQEIAAGKTIKASGIKLSIYIMPGVGGKALSESNAFGTARVITAVEPDFVRIRTAVITRDSGLWEDYEKGDYQLCGDTDKIKEIKLIIENAKNCTGQLVSGDHILNLLPNVNGNFNQDHEEMIAKIDEYLALSLLKQRVYQFLRRQGSVSQPSDLVHISRQDMQEAEDFCGSFASDDEWNLEINRMMSRFI
ncbi:MAG: radical SAM protein [Clostridia bacterium]|nr:radical SAM protein [Clostridia bacterium]